MKNKKCILHISKYYYPDRGGIESVAKQVVDGLKDDYDNVVICFSNDKYDHDDVVDGIRVVRVGVQASFMSQDISLGYYNKLKGLIRECNPFAIHVHCPNPFVYPLVCSCARKDDKIVLHWHSDILSKGIAYYAIKIFETRILKRANLIIATSENYKVHSKPLSPYLHKISILPNGIIPGNFDKKEGDDEQIGKIRETYKGKKLILFVGRHIPYKGIDLLIKSEGMITGNCQILIAGSGPLTATLKQQSKGKERITFLGRVSDDELRQYMWASDIFGFASNTKAEAFGVALAEAMYCENVPVVFHIEGSGVNWVSVNGETGLEVPLGDIEEYARAIDTLISNDDVRNKMAKQARQRVLSLFSESMVFEMVNDIYSNL